MAKMSEAQWVTGASSAVERKGASGFSVGNPARAGLPTRSRSGITEAPSEEGASVMARRKLRPSGRTKPCTTGRWQE